MISDSTQIALISSGAAVASGLIATVGVIANGIITRRAVRTSRAQSHEEHARTAKRVETVEQKTDTVIEKAVEIHTLTNSNLSRVTGQLEVANTKLEAFAEAQRVSDRKVEDLQSLVATLVEQERVVEKAVNETNGILKKDSGPLPVQDDQLAKKIDGIVTPKLNKLQDTVDEKG